jgi:hypothetical protein
MSLVPSGDASVGAHGIGRLVLSDPWSRFRCMFESVDPAGAVAQIRDGIDTLLDSDLSRLGRDELLTLVRDLERQTRRLPAVDHVVVAEVDQRGLAGELACASTTTLLHELLHISPTEANARVQAARELTTRHGLSGEILPPLFGAVASAQRAGTISTAHARVITRLLHTLPADTDREYSQAIEACLLQHAPGLDPPQLARAAQRLRARLDPDGPEPNDRENQRRRTLTLHKNHDGTANLTGRLTPATTAVWDAIIDALAAPLPAQDGTPDQRTPGQRRHDALHEAGMRLLQSGTLPDSGGTPVTVLAIVHADDLRDQLSRDQTSREQVSRDDDQSGNGRDDVTSHAGRSSDVRAGSGYASTGHGDLLSVTELLTLAAEADIIPVVLNTTGGILSYGRTRRLATCAQRQALAARDHGCSFPGCTRPPAWCQSHHIRPWIDGGQTDIGQLTLLCGYHHREFAKRGWRCQMINETPHWIPPAWLDPDQTPIRNTAHHLELHFNIAS